ncbi:MAG: TauD/TfdA family dioxygenase [Propionivibrio sp.]|nr:TauD/TfdA family dioxygenase [Propionivibrio sp.]
MTVSLPAHTRIDVVPIAAALGAEIRGVNFAQLDAAAFKTIHDAWLSHILLVFRGQSLGAAELAALAPLFGAPRAAPHRSPYAPSTMNAARGLPATITVVSNLAVDGNAIGILGNRDVAWHSDFSYQAAPPAASLLAAIEAPPRGGGGNTHFLNAYAAFDALPAELRQRIAGKTIADHDADDEPATGAAPRAQGHPLICTHPATGCSSLFLGRRHGTYVCGCTPAESVDLLGRLWEACVQQRFCYEHAWSIGDIVVWDNRCTLHRRDAFDAASRRLLYAAYAAGHSPYAAPDALRCPAHPRSLLFALECGVSAT